jgi:YidC/Oxa1 family membrane protein insertase
MWLHSLLGNWGWAIVALTLVIRLLMYPLTYKGMVSMQKLKEVAPKVKELQAKYKGDPQRMNAAVMDLYKKNGANPLGGCLPLLLQIPVFFAIYRVLLNAVELQGAEWILWIDDLSKMDSFFVLPILMGATMYYQQRITPSNFTDPMQEKVFRFLPIIFTFFFITFPSGLVLYWFINNLFSIAQQFFVNKKFESIKAERHEKHLAEKSHSDQKDTKQSNEN